MKNRVLAGLAVGALSAMCANSWAAESELRPYVSGLYNLTFTEGNQTKRGEGWSISAGKALNQYWGIEFGGFYSNFDSQSPTNSAFREYGGSLDGLFFYSRQPAFSPYFAIGGGYVENEAKDGSVSEGSPYAAAGFGFMKAVGDHLGIRADVRYRVVNNETLNDLAEPIARFGVVYALGPKPSSADERKLFDSDGDGVLEDKDRCPGTPQGVPVDETGCPDSDGDGVGDAYDECPGTPKGVRVDSRGCSLDSDGDGVFDYADRCPNTPAGVTVDADGCPVTGDLVRKFEDVNFAFDRAALTDYARITLDNTAKVINELHKQNPAMRVEVDGHTDLVGTDEYNLDLGLRRARIVKDYLIKRGVDRSLISTRSYGETQPIASNKTEKGRLLNRRAEIRANADSGK